MNALTLVFVLGAVAVILLVLAYLIRIYCCTGWQNDPSRLQSAQSSFADGQLRQEHFDGTSSFRGGSGRVSSSAFPRDQNRFHVENERRWPQPYFVRGDFDRWPPSGSSQLRPDFTDPNVGAAGYVAGRSGGERRQSSYAVAAGGSVRSERKRPKPYDEAVVPSTSSRSQQRKAVPVAVVHQQPPPKLDENDPDVNNMILGIQGNFRDDNTPTETIGHIQKLILLLTLGRELQIEDCRLIIGVDATPATLAGYCINLKEKRVSYYVVKRDDLPWVLHDPKDPSEFEMKNFMFALTLWEDAIVKHKRIRIYTDNFAITKADYFDGKKYGDRAFQVLRHLRNCKGVTVLNINSMAVNRFKNLKLFATYIQPADDLSRWQIGKAVDFLTKYYDIDQENVHGTHALDMSRRRPGKKDWYKATERYQQVLSYAKNKIDCHDCPNASCSGTDLLQASLRRSKSSQRV